MELHWKKFQVLQVQSKGDICNVDGSLIETTSVLQYLGAYLNADGNLDHELARKIALAHKDFILLRNVWSHSSLTWPRKLRIFSAIIEAKLLYGLAGACLTKAQLARLNGFQNRCVRSIIGIKPSWLSRVSNADVLRRCGHTSACRLLLRRQLQLFGKVLRAGEAHPLHAHSFVPGTQWPLTERFIRRLGRPSKEFIPFMIQEVSKLCGSLQTGMDIASQPRSWAELIRKL